MEELVRMRFEALFWTEAFAIAQMLSNMIGGPMSDEFIPEKTYGQIKTPTHGRAVSYAVLRAAHDAGTDCVNRLRSRSGTPRRAVSGAFLGA